MSLKIKNKQLAIVSDFDINNNRLMNVSLPISDYDAVNKEYIDVNAINYALGTGLYSGGTITIVDDTHFTVSGGTGFFVNPLSKAITTVIWTDKINIPIMAFGPTDITISVAIDINGNVYQQIPKFTNIQRNQYIILGELVIHPTNRILLSPAAFFPILSRDLPSVIDFALSNGVKNLDGNNITPNGNNLSLNVTSGQFIGYSINAINSLEIPNTSNLPALTNISFFRSRYNGIEHVYDAETNVIQPEFWSNGTATLQSSTPSKYNLRVIFRGAANGTFFMMNYPTQTREFDNINDAESSLNAINLEFPKELYGLTVPLCYIIVRGNATDLSDIAQCKIIPIQSVSTSTGSIATNANDVSFDSSLATNLNESNVQEAIVSVNNKIESFNYSFSNIGMLANSGSSAIYLATNSAIIDIPATMVKVDINGLNVIVGNGTTNAYCYFSNDGGITAKTYLNVQQGDYLYWNGNVAQYQLDSTDIIDFIYMVI